MRDRSRGSALLSLMLLVPLLAACGDDGAAPSAADAETISRDVFVATYVDLRLTALRSGSEEISPSARDEVLARHGVTPEDLLEFVEIHGDRVQYMKELWNEVETRIDSIRDPDDTTSS